MIPVEVTLTNFLGYDDNGGVGYIYDFRDHRLWSISGDNGAGKSAIFDAITYLLFCHHRCGQSRDEELLHKGANEMRCSFSFEHFGRLYRITRTLKKRMKRTGAETVERACQLDLYDSSAGAWREVPGTSSVGSLEEYVRTNLLGFDYDTFISSVLLVQGESDKLIRAAAKDRFNYLAGILDLRQYRRLEERAGQKARTFRSQHDILADTLGQIGIPSGEEVAQAAARAIEDESAHGDATEQLQQARARHQRVFRFHELLGRQGRVATKAAEFAHAQAQAADIRDAAKRKSVIADVLPRLREARSALENAQLADREAKEARDAGAAIDLAVLDAAVAAAETAHTGVKSTCDAKSVEVRDKRNERRQLEVELVPARHLGELDRSVAEANEKIAVLSSQVADLPELVKRRDRLDALHRCGLLIKEYAEAREQEGKALGSTSEEQLRSAAESASDSLAAAHAMIPGLHETIGVRHGEVGQLQGELAVAQQSLVERQQAGTEGTCSHCGQRVTAEHIQVEISKCKAEIKRIETALVERQKALDAAKSALESAERSLPGLQEMYDEARGRVNLLEKARARSAELDRHELMPELPEDCHEVLVGPAPEVAVGLARFRQELAARAVIIGECQRLSGLESDLRSQQALVEGWSTEHVELLKKISAERASQVLGLSQELDQQILCLEDQEQDLTRALEGATEEVERLRRERQEAGGRRVKLENTAQVQATVAEGFRASAISAVLGVAQEFLPVSNERIEALEGKLTELADAEERLALLESAEKELTGLKGQLHEIEEELAKVPEEDRIPLADAQAAVDAGKQAASLVEEAARQSRQLAVELAKTRDERLGMQQQAEQLGRAYTVWDRLAKLLGRGGIQLALLKHDLAEIEKLANVLLARISGGNLRLQIEYFRGRTGEEIIFRCIDGASADQALDVAFLSGGQKFRVAVALAAGIGQYAGLGGSMPSQIIDEGFGSLDAGGRQEMLDAIREMSQYFERIIVISHTESFHDPSLFPARYELRKDGRRTLVTASV